MIHLDESDLGTLRNTVSGIATNLSEAPYTDLVRRAAAEGLLGAIVPEGSGGLDLDAPSAAVIVSSFAEVLLTDGIVEALIAARMFAHTMPEFAPALVEGRAFATAHLPRILPQLSNGKLSGEVLHVPFGAEVDYLVTLANDGNREVVIIVEMTAPGVSWRVAPGLDLERPHAHVILGKVQPASVSLEDGAAKEMRFWLAALRTVWFSTNIRKILAETVAHLTTREQFGKPLVTLPVLRQTLAEQQLLVENLGLLSEDALQRCELGAALTALEYAVRTGPGVAEKCLHLFGGMGFTWEMPMHRYLRRIRMMADTNYAAADRLATLDPLNAVTV